MKEWWMSLTGWQQVAVIVVGVAGFVALCFTPMCTIEVTGRGIE